MKLYSLASGSSGNCFLIDNGKQTILIDVGITFNKIKEKLTEINYDINAIDYILITHEHGDHIKSLNNFPSNKLFSGVNVPGVNHIFKKNEEIRLGDYLILTYPLSHDVDCCGYRITYKDEVLVYATDTGYISYKIKPYLFNATYYVFESNHEGKMLMDSKRPFFLKSRILADDGHLSNDDASEILKEIIGEKTKEIYLAHVSNECNTKQKAYDTLVKTLVNNNVDYKRLRIEVLDKEEILKGGKIYDKDSLSV